MGQSANREPARPPGGGEAREFTTTHWSAVLAAGHGSAPGAREALESLCRAYWYPLYASVRRRGYTAENAQDLTQAFFARLLEKQVLALADRERGRFRTFLLTALQNFLHKEWEKGQAEKRGGSCALLSLDEQDAEGRYLVEPVEDLTPERLFEKRWATTLLERAMSQLRDEFVTGGKAALFEALAEHVWGDGTARPHKELAGQFDLTENALGVALHRMRARFRELLRAEVAHTVGAPGDVDEELEHLVRVMRDQS